MMFIAKFPFGPLKTNAILIGCPATKSAAVIDPSLGSTEALLSEAKKHSFNIEKILLTHSHWDHIADLFPLREKTKAAVYVHPLDEKNLSEPGSDQIPLFVSIQPVKTDFFLNENDVIQIGNLHAQVIHTPGHSKGSVCFYFQKEALLVAGDTLFKGTIGSLSLPTSNADEMWPSLQKLAKLPPQTRVVSGHGPDTTIGQEHWLSRAKEIFSE